MGGLAVAEGKTVSARGASSFGVMVGIKVAASLGTGVKVGLGVLVRVELGVEPGWLVGSLLGLQPVARPTTHARARHT